MLPVIPGCGGHRPGQNRDNFSSGYSLAFYTISYVGIALLAVGMVHVGGDRRGPRSRAEIDRERHALHERTASEVDQMVAEFHDQMPRHKAESIGAIYCRYSTRFQDSIADQVRKIMEDAVRRQVFIPREYVFFDMAVRGYKSHREGLDGLREALRSKKVSVAMFFATNRLFRKVHRTLEFVEEELVEKGIRAVFVKSGVDTNDKEKWRMLLTFHSTMDEFVVGMYSDNIRAAHEGLLEKLYVFGTISYGFAGEPIDGETTRRGRPRCRLVVDPMASVVVGQIFVWHVIDRLTIDEIIRRLNDDPTIPLPPRCTSGMWTRLAVKKVLTNPRYRGFWQYGVTESVWISSKDYARQQSRPEPLKEVQVEKLRIVSDQIWFDAQRRLAEESRNGGRPPIDGDRRSRPKVLNGILWCPEHGRPLQAGGPHGLTMVCPNCRRLKSESRPLYTHLNRALALRMTCEKLAELVRADDDLVRQVTDVCQRQVGALQRPDPARIDQLRTQEEQLTRRIRFVMAHVGDTDEDQREAAVVITELRQQRNEVRAEQAALEERYSKPVEMPTGQQIRDLLNDFGSVLTAAASGEIGDQIGQVREIISQLTGGRIELYQRGERKAQRGWLQGRFRVPLLSIASEKLMGVTTDDSDDCIEVTIDFKRPAKSYDAEAEKAKELYDKGMMNKQIAAELGCSPAKVTKLLDWWFEAHGVPKPDSYARCAELRKKQSPPIYQQIADQAAPLWNEGVGIEAIARRLGHDKATVRKAVAHWHRARGLPEPTAGTRRERLMDRVKALFDEGHEIQGIAATVGHGRGCIRKLIKQWHERRGLEAPDGRLCRAVERRVR